MSKVYIVNEPLKKDHATGKWSRWIDTTSALQFGLIQHILPAGQQPSDTRVTISQIEESLANLTVDDYLLLVGNPEVIAWASIIAARKCGGQLRTLVWRRGQYVPHKVQLWNEE